MIRTISILSFADAMMIWTSYDRLSFSGPWFAVIHIVLTLWALLIWRSQFFEIDSLESISFPVGAALGPCGILVFLLLKPWSRIGRRIKRLTYSPVKLRKRRLSNAVTPLSVLKRILDERVRYPEADHIESLATTLLHGSLSSRRNALEIAVRSFEPRLSPLIAMALTDKDQTIRALAAAAAAQVSYNLAQRRAELDAKIMLHENQEDSYLLSTVLADHGCHNVLLSQSQRMHLCQEAVELLKSFERVLGVRDRRRKEVTATLAELAGGISLYTASMPRAVRIQAVESVA